MKKSLCSLLVSCCTLLLVSCDNSSGGTNLLNSIHSGGAAKVVAITATDADGTTEDSDLVYDDEDVEDFLDQDCSAEWFPQGSLCDEAGTTHSKTLSTKNEADSGATWEADDGEAGLTIGILIIDACSDDSCQTISFGEARVFQMFSDGKTTHLRLSIHPETGDVAPSWNDEDWEAVSDFEAIGPGTDVNAGGDEENDRLVVGDPTIIATDSQTTRYIKVEVRNDGSLEDEESEWIELRSLKLF